MERPEKIRSLPDALARCAREWPQRGIHFFDGDGVRHFISYPQLLSGAQRACEHLRRQGLPAGSRAILALPSSQEFVQVFFGAMMARVQPIPVMPPRSQASLTPYLTSLRELGERVRAQALITPPPDVSLLLERAEIARAFEWTLSADRLTAMLEPTDEPMSMERAPDLDDIAYLQCTSGTTGPPKSAALSHRSLLANLEAIGRHIDIRDDDKGVSWLPLVYDMGLVGALLFSIYWGIPLYQLHSDRFLKAPQEWLWCFARHGGTISLSPDFGFHYCARRAPRSSLENLDLSSWRVAICGSEPIQLDHLRAFVDRFTPYGLPPDIITPVYGLTEASLGVTFCPVNRPWRIDRVDRAVLETENQAQPSDDPQAREVLSLGAPLPCLEISIQRDGQALPERQIGEIHIKGTSVMAGYGEQLHEDHADPDEEKPWVATGDLGYLAGGELYITGRSTDVIHLEQREVYPDELEALASLVDGVRPGSVAVFGVPRSAAALNRHASIRAVAEQASQDRPVSASMRHEETATGGPELLIVACEVVEGFDHDALCVQISDLLHERVDLRPHDVRILTPGSIPRTASGKVRRFLCRERYLDEALDQSERQERWQRLTRVTEDIRTYFADLNRRIRKRFER